LPDYPDWTRRKFEMKRNVKINLAALGLLILVAVTKNKKTGIFLGIPYDLRPPTYDRIKQRYWNPDDPHLFTPRIFGWGWAINLYALVKRLGWLHQRDSKDEPAQDK